MADLPKLRATTTKESEALQRLKIDAKAMGARRSASA
jgi:hypothetical protein